MKITFCILTVSLVIFVNNVFADDPEKTRIENQLRDVELLMQAMAAADAIPVPDAERGETERQKYRVRDALGELALRSYKNVADLIGNTTEADWGQLLSKSEWTHRLIEHFFKHHTGSGNEEWVTILSQLCINNKPAVLNLFPALADDEKARLLKTLNSPLNGHKPTESKEFANELAAIE